MSAFGGPGGPSKIARPTPPERGSFPLDHDGECSHIMKRYVRCLRSHAGNNSDECRQISKWYLKCRMDHNLMARDEMKNLGYTDDDRSAYRSALPSSPSSATTPAPSIGSAVATTPAAAASTASTPVGAITRQPISITSQPSSTPFTKPPERVLPES